MSKRLAGIALVAGIVVLAALLFLERQPIDAQRTTTEDIIRTVSVSGTGTISAKPDQATIQLGVRTQGTTSSEAVTENNSRMSTLLDTLKQSGIDEDDIQTRDFSIWPQYSPDAIGQDKIASYEVSNTVVVTVKNLDNLGSILDAAVNAGSNQVHGIQFGFSDPKALVDDARIQAITDAKRKATQYADLSEMTLGPVISISEGAAPPPTIMRAEAASMALGDASVPIESGSASVSLTVQVTYELAP